MNIIKSSKSRSKKRRIFAADDDSYFDDNLLEEDEGLGTTLDNIQDNIEDIQDTVDEIEPDDPNIEMDNNIEDHYIAECDRCHGIFISAVIKSDQKVDKISGTCPLCEKESDQYLKWVVEKVSD